LGTLITYNQHFVRAMRGTQELLTLAALAGWR